MDSLSSESNSRKRQADISTVRQKYGQTKPTDTLVKKGSVRLPWEPPEICQAVETMEELLLHSLLNS